MYDLRNVNDFDAEIFKKMDLFIKNNYQRPIYIADIASAGAVCKSKCNILFHRVSQKSPNEYLNDIRLENCRRLLEESDFSLSDIAQKCGYSDQSYFCRNFFRRFNVSPHVYRKSFEGNRRSPLVSDFNNMDFALETFCAKYTDVIKVNFFTGEYSILKTTTHIKEHYKDFYSLIRSSVNVGQVAEQDIKTYLDFFKPGGYVCKSLMESEIPELKLEYRRKFGGVDYWSKIEVIVPFFFSRKKPFVLVTRNIEGLCSSENGMNSFYIPYFQKVLQADLHDDTYSIVKVHKDELPFNSASMSSLSGWLDEFCKSDILYEADREPFASNANIKTIRSYFNSSAFAANEDKSYSLKYRRLINGQYKWVKMEIIPSSNFSYSKQDVFLSIRQLEY